MAKSSRGVNGRKSRAQSRNVTTRRSSRSKLNEKYQLEQLYQKAVEWLNADMAERKSSKPRYREATEKFGPDQIAYFTLRNRFLKKHQAAGEAHQKQMILTPVQEKILVEYGALAAQEARPWSRAQLKQRVKRMSGKIPSDNWILAFERRHAKDLAFRGTSGLDPKRAQCFNPGTVKHHFEIYGPIYDQHRIKINVDETGQQLGGGRKRTGKKHYVVPGDRQKYRSRDGNLELVTVIEASCSDGTMLDPGFIFSGSSMYSAEWFEGHDHKKIS